MVGLIGLGCRGWVRYVFGLGETSDWGHWRGGEGVELEEARNEDQEVGYMCMFTPWYRAC